MRLEPLEASSLRFDAETQQWLQSSWELWDFGGNGSPAIVFASDSKNLSPQMNFQKGLSVGAFVRLVQRFSHF